MDSIINKSPLSARSNRMIGGQAPSEYLRRIEEDQGLSPEQLDEILRSHLIEPAHLRANDFEAFYLARKAALAGLVERAMGVEVRREPEEEEAHYPAPAPVEEDILEQAY